MAWFQKEMDYARESLATASSEAIDKAGERLSNVMRDGVELAGRELSNVVQSASQEIDTKLDKISLELHNQRQFTKDDVKELVDYAAGRLSVVLDDRIGVMKREISTLAAEKTEDLKREVDSFFIQRQQDLARERRRMVFNVALAVVASLGVGLVGLWYKGIVGRNSADMFEVFRIVLASLAGGYGVYLAVNLLTRWLRLSEHRKDLLFLAARYWGVLRPSSVFATVVMLLIAGLVILVLAFPYQMANLFGITLPPPR
jgi:F0F1-type ATP synthase membrane subunit b/b'